MPGNGTLVVLGAAALGAGAVAYLALSSGSLSLTINGGKGPLTVSADEIVTFSARGGTKGGNLTLYIANSPTTFGATAQILGFDADGNWVEQDPFVWSGTVYFAVSDDTTGALSNWVEVQVG